MRLSKAGNPQAIATAAASHLLKERVIILSAAGDLCAQMMLEVLVILPTAVQQQQKKRHHHQRWQHQKQDQSHAQQEVAEQQQQTEPQTRLRVSVDVQQCSQPGKYGKLEVYNFQAEMVEVQQQQQGVALPAQAVAALAGHPAAAAAVEVGSPRRADELEPAPGARASGQGLVTGCLAERTKVNTSSSSSSSPQNGRADRARHRSSSSSGSRYQAGAHGMELPQGGKVQELGVGVWEGSHQCAPAAAQAGGVSAAAWSHEADASAHMHTSLARQCSSSSSRSNTNISSSSRQGVVDKSERAWGKAEAEGNGLHMASSSSTREMQGWGWHHGEGPAGSGMMGHHADSKWEMEGVISGPGRPGGERGVSQRPAAVLLKQRHQLRACGSSFSTACTADTQQHDQQQQQRATLQGPQWQTRDVVDPSGDSNVRAVVQDLQGAKHTMQQQQPRQQTLQWHGQEVTDIPSEHVGVLKGGPKHVGVASQQYISRYSSGGSRASSGELLAEPASYPGLLPLAANSLDMADAIETCIAVTGQAHAAVAYRKHAGRVLQAAAIVSRRLAGQATLVQQQLQQQRQAQQQQRRGGGKGGSILVASSSSSGMGDVVGSRLCLLCSAGEVPRASGSKKGVHLYFYVV